MTQELPPDQILGPKPELRIGHMLKSINESMEKNANNAMQACGITVAQFKMLLFLHLAVVDSVSMKEIEHFFRVAQSTAAGIAVRLEKKKLIESFTDADDKRIKRLRITPAGRELCETHRKYMDAAEEYLLSGLSPGERALFRELLLRIYGTIH